MAERPHFAFPFQRGSDGKVTVVEQDTIDHVNSCENVIVRCPVGFREERPEFGIPWPEFANIPINPGQITVALQRFEPRGDANGYMYGDIADASIRHLLIDVGVKI